MTADFNIRTREELAAASPAFPLTGIIDSYGFNPELEINLMQPRWLERINECYTEENLPLMKAYLLCRVAGSCISRLDEACYREGQRLKMAYEGTSETQSDEYYASRETTEILSGFVEQAYVEKYCSEKTKKEITDLAAEVIAEYREMLGEES